MAVAEAMVPVMDLGMEMVTVVVMVVVTTTIMVMAAAIIIIMAAVMAHMVMVHLTAMELPGVMVHLTAMVRPLQHLRQRHLCLHQQPNLLHHQPIRPLQSNNILLLHASGLRGNTRGPFFIFLFIYQFRNVQ